jgi:hypothetical protein
VTVTVGAGGVLQEITFGTKAYKRPPEALSALVMQLIAAAQKEVSAEVYGAFGGLVGESSDVAVLQEFLPEPDEDEDQTTPPPPPPAAPPWQHGPQQPLAAPPVPAGPGRWTTKATSPGRREASWQETVSRSTRLNCTPSAGT